MLWEEGRAKVAANGMVAVTSSHTLLSSAVDKAQFHRISTGLAFLAIPEVGKRDEKKEKEKECRKPKDLWYHRRQ